MNHLLSQSQLVLSSIGLREKQQSEVRIDSIPQLHNLSAMLRSLMAALDAMEMSARSGGGRLQANSRQQDQVLKAG